MKCFINVRDIIKKEHDQSEEKGNRFYNKLYRNETMNKNRIII